MNKIPRRFRTALITGASSGIGAGFARALPDTTSLLLTGRDAAALSRLAAELGRGGRDVQTLTADLATPEGRDEVIGWADGFGVDLFVCNAGLGPFGAFLEAPLDMLEATVSVNVLAPVVLIRRLLPGMIDRANTAGGRAGLIVLSSNAAFLPVPKLATYAASKAFDLSLTESIAAELSGRPVDVLAVCPTATRSNFARRSGFQFGNLPGAQDPQQVARAALRAIGRQRTLVLGPVSAALLTGQALMRAAVAQTLATVLRAF